MADQPKPLNLVETMELMDSSQLDQLTQQLEERVKKKSADMRSLLMLGLGYYLRGQMKSAIQIFERAISVNPNLPYAYYYLGIAYYRMVNLDMAITMLRKVINLTPKIIMAHYWLGITYWHKGDNEQALAAFEQLLQHNAESPIAHYHAALACLAEQYYEKALFHLEALRETNTIDSRMFLHLGNVYFRLNRVQDAITAYRQGLILSPNNTQIKEALAYLVEVPEP